MLRKTSMTCALLAIPLVAYGAIGRDTIGGLKFLATVLALALAGVGLAAAGMWMVRKRGSRRAALLTAALNASVGAGAVIVLLTREFSAGYMAC